MLPRPNRLPSFEISALMRSGKRVSASGITLIYRNAEIPGIGAPLIPGIGSRFAFVVSTKVDKRAVVRNRMRRLMSESVRLLLPVTPGIDCIFIGSKQLIGKTQQDMRDVIEHILYETTHS